jgi:hypothetical protein
MEQILQLWNDFQGWFIGVGLSGTALIATNIGLKLRGNNLIKKSIKGINPILTEVGKIGDDIIEVAQGIIDVAKDIKNDVFVALEKVKGDVGTQLSTIKNEIVGYVDSKFNALFDAINIIIAITPNTPSVKEKSLEALKSLVKNDVVKQLVEDVKKENVIDTEDTDVDAIIND